MCERCREEKVEFMKWDAEPADSRKWRGLLGLAEETSEMPA